MEGGRKNVLGSGTRKRTWARSGRVEAGFKAERVRKEAIAGRSVSAAGDVLVCARVRRHLDE